MVFADYDFYKDRWGGTMSAADFSRMTGRVSYVLDCMTNERAGKLWESGTQEEKDAISMAACSLAEYLLAAEKTGGRAIALEIVGKHHVSYAEATQSEQQRMRSAVRPYLCGLSFDGTGLLFRGVDAGYCRC